MSMQDPIADMFARIKNAQARSKREVSMPLSKQKKSIAEVLKQEGYITDYRVDESGKHSNLTIELRYYDSKPVIEGLKRISRPGLRVYRATTELPKVVGGLGVAIVSTSQGVMTDRKARELGIGGEVICSVY